MIRIGIVGGTGYTGVELLRLLAQHPEADVRAITSRKDAGTQVAHMFPSLRGRYDLAFTDPKDADLAGCDVVFFATPHGVAMAQARELRRGRRADHRPRRRLPAAGSRAVRALVQDAARVPGSARGGGLRPARNQSRGDPQGAHRRQSGLLSDGGAARLPAADRSGPRRHRAPDRRLQVGRVGRGPQGRAVAARSPKRPTTSPRTASPAIATCPRSCRG